ncbi:hypothetical protein PUNSTDRAFT_138102 [Punctularia strigosozonata HHB-11173 SS5]|uniref:Uncharacterized protein n=1 Tax=Punctularia strigosozonata (strain HHB-11173) TaxID=741275 RepID=R7S500_PUNST|nr:uncharacterized protein PUNSTDRAFT_138102 [Punctularia strigosozonata HHB-11173 SS5]EIN04907.1 hypothetical protein PUNSTDRAFT_138102 [Punctularia strigosozonata HHB-11173 SS5]
MDLFNFDGLPKSPRCLVDDPLPYTATSDSLLEPSLAGNNFADSAGHGDSCAVGHGLRGSDALDVTYLPTQPHIAYPVTLPAPCSSQALPSTTSGPAGIAPAIIEAGQNIHKGASVSEAPQPSGGHAAHQDSHRPASKSPSPPPPPPPPPQAPPSPTQLSQRSQKKPRTRFTSGELYELAKKTVDVNPYGKPHGKVTQAWMQIAEHLHARGMFEHSSVQTIKNKMNAMVAYHQGTAQSVSHDIQSVLDGVGGVSFGAILDTAVSQKEEARDMNSKSKAQNEKKKAKDREGGAHIRAAAMKTLKWRRSDTPSDSNDGTNSENDLSVRGEHSEADHSDVSKEVGEQPLSKRQRTDEKTHELLREIVNITSTNFHHLETIQAQTVSEIRRFVDVQEHGNTIVVAAIEGLADQSSSSLRSDSSQPDAGVGGDWPDDKEV